MNSNLQLKSKRGQRPFQFVLVAQYSAFFRILDAGKIFDMKVVFLLLQWCQLESLQVLFYEAKVPTSDGYGISKTDFTFLL